MPDLIAQIRAARAVLRAEEGRTHDAAVELRNCKDREKRAKLELDALLDELETGRSRYPLLEDAREAAGPPSPAADDGRGKRGKEAGR